MEKKFLSLLLVSALGLVGPSIASAEDEPKTCSTDKGKKFILHADGTWSAKKEQNASSKEESQDDSEEEQTKDSKNNDNYACSEVIESQHDKMTGEKSKSVKEPIMLTENVGLTVTMPSGSRELGVGTFTNDSGFCVEADGKMYALLEDDTVIKTVNGASFNCRGQFVAFFSLGSDLNMLAEKKIKTIRVETKKGRIEEDLTQETSKRVRAVFQCFREELKADSE